MIFSFNDCELDVGTFELRRNGEGCAVEPRVFELLSYLVQNRDRMVTKVEIFEQIWDGRTVSDSALSSQIKAVRRAIGDDGKSQSLLRTVHGKGFRFIGQVTERRSTAADGTGAPSRSAAVTGPPDPVVLERPSIAVLPFENLSGDPDQEYFSDGLAEDIITALSKYRWFFVTARNSTFSYKGETPSVRQVAAELGVRYVMEGSARRAGERVRINCQLIDAHSGIQLWAERYDRELADILTVQDEITSSIVGAVAPEIGNAEEMRARRAPIEDMDAWDFHQRGMWHLWRYTPEDGARSREYFERAIELDPTLASAYSGLGLILSHHVLMGWTDDPATVLSEARQSTEQALTRDPRDAFAHYTMGRILTLYGEHEPALVELHEAHDLNPNFALTHFGLGFSLVWFGRTSEALPYLERAIQQSPNDPVRWSFELITGIALWWEGRHDEAAAVLTKARRHSNADFWPAAAAAVNYITLGDEKAAGEAVSEAMRKRPDLSVGVVERIMATVVPEISTRFIGNLKTAGMP